MDDKIDDEPVFKKMGEGKPVFIFFCLDAEGEQRLFQWKQNEKQWQSALENANDLAFRAGEIKKETVYWDVYHNFDDERPFYSIDEELADAIQNAKEALIHSNSLDPGERPTTRSGWYISNVMDRNTRSIVGHTVLFENNRDLPFDAKWIIHSTTDHDWFFRPLWFGVNFKKMIDKHFLQLALPWHPDKSGQEFMFKTQLDKAKALHTLACSMQI